MRYMVTLLVASAFVLSGCTSEKPQIKGNVVAAVSTLKTVLKRKSKTTGSNPLEHATRAQLQGVAGSVLFAHLNKAGAYATLSLIGNNKGVQTFITNDSISISMQSGVILATRGLGGDLMSADVSGSVAALNKQTPGQYTRTMRRLNGQDAIQTTIFTCKMANIGPETLTILGTKFSTQHFKERCNAANQTFENDYWQGRKDPVIWQSQQWLGDATGDVTLQLLVK